MKTYKFQFVFFLLGIQIEQEMSYPPPSPGGYPMYGAPPMPGGGSQYPAPGPALGFDSIANQPPMGAPGVCM